MKQNKIGRGGEWPITEKDITMALGYIDGLIPISSVSTIIGVDTKQSGSQPYIRIALALKEARKRGIIRLV